MSGCGAPRCGGVGSIGPRNAQLHGESVLLPAWAASSHSWPEKQCWGPLLSRIAKEYLPYLHQNALAFRRGDARFDFTGARHRFKQTMTTDYRVWRRQNLQRLYAALPSTDRTRVDVLFAPHGGLGSLTADGEIDAGMDAMFELPRPVRPARLVRPHKLSLRMALLGQARN